MTDVTEGIRRALVEEINSEAGSREILESRYGKVWSTDEVREEFEVIGFMAPFVVVRRRVDGVKGICSITVGLWWIEKSQEEKP